LYFYRLLSSSKSTIFNSSSSLSFFFLFGVFGEVDSLPPESVSAFLGILGLVVGDLLGS